MDTPVRRDAWRQNNPFDQLVVLIGCLDGHLSNYQCSIIDRKRFAEYYKDVTTQMAELAPFIEKGSW